MKKFLYVTKKLVKESRKGPLIVYLVLRLLVILCMIREGMNGNYENVMLCIFSLVLFTIPITIEKTFKIEFPDILQIIMFLFIFSAEILGEINNFYGTFEHFDTILHTLTGFWMASIGFSLVNLLNENSKKFKLSPFFVALVGFCFSMTIGVMWEFLEYNMDTFLKTDTQKDKYIYEISTVTLDPELKNKTVIIKDIDKTILYDKDGNELAVLNGYLDVGLHDTIEDMFVNFMGAILFSIFGYLYVCNEEKYIVVGKLLTQKKEE